MIPILSVFVSNWTDSIDFTFYEWSFKDGIQKFLNPRNVLYFWTNIYGRDRYTGSSPLLYTHFIKRLASRTGSAWNAEECRRTCWFYGTLLFSASQTASRHRLHGCLGQHKAFGRNCRHILAVGVNINLCNFRLLFGEQAFLLNKDLVSVDKLTRIIGKRSDSVKDNWLPIIS